MFLPGLVGPPLTLCRVAQDFGTGSRVGVSVSACRG